MFRALHPARLLRGGVLGDGLTVPRGQLRTITTYVKLSDGSKVRTVQFLRLCLDRDGNPNDTPTQDRANK